MNMLVDGEPRTLEFQFFEINSHPLDFDSDNDRLNDSVEVNGWNVTVVNRSNEMYRWNSTEQLEPGESRGTVNFTSSPLRADTDGDGLTDYEEKERYHTDPESRVTYEITREHQREIIGVLTTLRDERYCPQGCGSMHRELEYMGIIDDDVPYLPDSVGDLDGFQLTDRTDDFDFVVPDDYAQQPDNWRRFSYRPLGSVGTEEATFYLADIWLANGEETRGLDPWDPDMDNDGVTDGQEMEGLVGIAPLSAQTPNPEPFRVNQNDPRTTDPFDPDSDGDGWWDGWIGVYDVGRSDNVILYGENLEGGIQDHEVVPQQAEIHEVPSDHPGSDIDGDGIKEHSNVHLGERYWGTDPTETSQNVPRSISVEVDWGINSNLTYNREAWETSIEDNFGIYGIRVDIIRDDTLSEQQMSLCLDGEDGGCITDPSDGFGYYEIYRIGDSHASEGADLHVVVLDKAGGQVPGGSNQTGVKLLGIPQIALFTDGQSDYVSIIDDSVVRNSTFETKLGIMAGKTLMHEIGHAFEFGELDDVPPLSSVEKFRQLGEVYSGASDDPTPEELESNNRNEWSIMASGYDDEMVSAGALNGSYFVFSIEELMREG